MGQKIQHMQTEHGLVTDDIIMHNVGVRDSAVAWERSAYSFNLYRYGPWLIARELDNNWVWYRRAYHREEGPFHYFCFWCKILEPELGNENYMLFGNRHPGSSLGSVWISHLGSFVRELATWPQLCVTIVIHVLAVWPCLCVAYPCDHGCEWPTRVTMVVHGLAMWPCLCVA